MSIIRVIAELRSLVRAEEVKPTIIILWSVLFLTIHRSFGSIEFATHVFSSDSTFVPVLYMFVAAFILLGIVPFAVIKLVFHESVQEYGLGLGDWRRGLMFVAVLFPIIAVSLLLPASHTGEMRAFYPFDKHATDSFGAFIQLQLARGIFFYTAWEFFFRGFMLFGLRKQLGDWMAICVQTIPSCLWHIGMPNGEVFSSIAAGILFGVIAVRTNSIVWSFLLHYLIGIGLDVFIITT